MTHGSILQTRQSLEREPLLVIWSVDDISSETCIKAHVCQELHWSTRLQHFLGASEGPQTEGATLFFHFKENKPKASGLGKGSVRKVLAMYSCRPEFKFPEPV